MLSVHQAVRYGKKSRMKKYWVDLEYGSLVYQLDHVKRDEAHHVREVRCGQCVLLLLPVSCKSNTISYVSPLCSDYLELFFFFFAGSSTPPILPCRDMAVDLCLSSLCSLCRSLRARQVSCFVLSISVCCHPLSCVSFSLLSLSFLSPLSPL